MKINAINTNIQNVQYRKNINNTPQQNFGSVNIAANPIKKVGSKKLALVLAGMLTALTPAVAVSANKVNNRPVETPIEKTIEEQDVEQEKSSKTKEDILTPLRYLLGISIFGFLYSISAKDQRENGEKIDIYE